MSGIILPGQEDKPQQSGGIELPKGFSRTRDQKEEPTPDAASEAPAQAASPEAEQPAQRSGQPEFLFPPQAVQIQCPACGTPYAVPVFSIIDLGVNPELRGALLGGQINVAVCSNCGAGGPLGAPLLLHDPEHEFLGAYIPPEAATAASSSGILSAGPGGAEMQRQKIIGDLTQTLMRKLPQEARRGYMLQAKEYPDWERFMEVLWGFEGVTPEMLHRQRDQSALLQRLMSLVDDPTALQLVLERDQGLIDRDFFAMLDQIAGLARAQGQGEAIAPLLAVRAQLLETTDAGAEIKAREDHIRGLLGQISETTTREEILDLLLGAWKEEDGRDIVASLAVALAPMLDYQFLVAVTERLETSADDDDEVEALESIRDLVTRIQESQRENQAQQAQEVQSILQEVLQATDVEAKLREFAPYINETFLAYLASNVRDAEQKGAGAAARRLREVYDRALDILQESMPADLRLLNDLLSAPDDAAMRSLLKENQGLITPDFLASLQPLEEEMRNNGRTDVADRIKSLSRQVKLMI